ncbi:hypothetical protein SELMODRAFT_405132 [Selaginella moellendorffii]|uniref:C2H2-type domain-containing protein n=1 Tax=Selaginella moellendorffii TaxID=88036 RepID=D8QYI2_SELML|nr:hypothetical protein SELMODRAFT_405132 [Selaginella moellendorffii]
MARRKKRKRANASDRPEVAPSIDALNARDDQQSKQMVVYADTSGFLGRQEEEAKEGQEVKEEEEVLMLELNPVSDPVEEDDDDDEEVLMLELNPVSDPVEEDDDDDDDDKEEEEDDEEEQLPGSSKRSPSRSKALKRTRTYKTGIYPCSICERVFKYSWHLKNHQLVHSDEVTCHFASDLV